MNSKLVKAILTVALGMLFPIISNGQSFEGEIRTMQSVLNQLYDEMIPLCDQLIGVGRGIAAFGALFYISSRVWKSIANAEPIDLYPLLRPFALGLAILLFPSVLDVMNAIMKPTVTGTAAMLEDSNNAVQYLLKVKEDAIKRTPLWQLYGDEGTHHKWYQYYNPEGEDEDPDLLTNGIKFLMSKTAFGIKNMIKLWLSEILHVVYLSASLCINALRTFYLIVLAILGPIVFGLSVFDGFQHTLTAWIARYINVYLWLPVANIFGSIIAKIQENMLRIDVEQVTTYGESFFSPNDVMYIVFLIIGIVGYFTVPSVSGYIVHAGGSNMLLYKSTNLFAGAAGKAISAVSFAAGALATSFRSTPSSEGTAVNSSGNDKDGFMRDKLTGNKKS